MISQPSASYHIVCSPIERHDSVVPTALKERQILLDTADVLLETFLPPGRYGDPDDPLGSALF